MSKWYLVDDGNIEIDKTGKEVNFLAGFDDHGNINITITFDQIKSIHKQIMDSE